MFRRRKIILVLIALVISAILLYPTLSAHLRATSLLLRMQDPKTTSLVATFNTNPVTITEIAIPSLNGPIRARLYLPLGVSHPPGIVIVHGIHHLGMDEPRLVAFARAFAASGAMVLTPELKELADYRVTPAGIATIGYAADELHSRVGHSVGVLGLSFAGGLALMAAADDRYKQDIAFVVSVGGHDDMARVARFLATGKTTRPDGSELTLAPHDYGALVLIYAQAERFFSPQDVPAATDAIRLWLYEQPDAARARATSLSPAGRARMDLLFSGHRDALREELLAAITVNEQRMDAVSPHGKLSHMNVPVLLLHGTGDGVIPASESQWLAREIPAQDLRALLISPAITHVQVGGEPSLADKLHLIHFIAQIFSELSH